MGAVNVTVRIDEESKKQFDTFCENVGINITTAFNMFIKATLRERKLPFIVTDIEKQDLKKVIESREKLKEVFKAAQEQSIINGTDNITMDEIDEIIAEVRKENIK
ncbi:MAG: type II toxin-antitoxin system RelB/DinJ family antitoxin [Oscillospiraceae bacterium]|nr:type II toxin-antitoxin system RelB/DinJ family antitoxin [Oscillospiraceae bacterium]